MIKLLIHFLERFINFFIGLVPIPPFIKPPEDTPVSFLHKHYLLFKGIYKQGSFQGEFVSSSKRSKYLDEDVIFWTFRDLISIPHWNKSLRTTQKIEIPDMLFRPSSDHVWEWVDGLGKKHHVTHNTRKYLERNPMGSTVKNKEKKLIENSEKAIERRHQQLKQIKGNSL